MTSTPQHDLAKLESLVKTATNPRQKAMYQELLDKAKQQATTPTNPTTASTTPQKSKSKPKKPKLTETLPSTAIAEETENTENEIVSPVTEATSPEVVSADANAARSTTDDLMSEETEETEEIEAIEAIEESENETEIAFFQAIGVIRGEVNLSEEGQHTVKIGGRTYPLFYLTPKIRAWNALKKEIEVTGEHNQRLLVYPKVTHFPKKEQPHRVSFQLLAFFKGEDNEGITQELGDGEFKLSGLWQFIPVCRTPCISILRNFTQERLEYVKKAEPVQKVRFMKASHLPLLWRDAPVAPFRFNPKAGKDQGHPSFVQIKAKFLPGKDLFGFMEQLAEPREKAPRFLKAKKEDKASAMAAKNLKGNSDYKKPSQELGTDNN